MTSNAVALVKELIEQDIPAKLKAQLVGFILWQLPAAELDRIAKGGLADGM